MITNHTPNPSSARLPKLGSMSKRQMACVMHSVDYTWIACWPAQKTDEEQVSTGSTGMQDDNTDLLATGSNQEALARTDSY